MSAATKDANVELKNLKQVIIDCYMEVTYGKNGEVKAERKQTKSERAQL